MKSVLLTVPLKSSSFNCCWLSQAIMKWRWLSRRNVFATDHFWKGQALRNTVICQCLITYLTHRTFSKIRDTSVSCHNLPWSLSSETQNKLNINSKWTRINIWDSGMKHSGWPQGRSIWWHWCRLSGTNYSYTKPASVVSKGYGQKHRNQLEFYTHLNWPAELIK